MEVTKRKEDEEREEPLAVEFFDKPVELVGS